MRAASDLSRALLLAALALGPGCVSVDWDRDSWATPPPDGVLAVLLTEGATLDVVLARLGAPLTVEEHRRDGVRISYGWRELDGKGVNVSVPVQDYSISLDYQQNRTGLRGLLLVFDADLRLVSAGEGWLDDPSSGRRRVRPSLPVDAREEAP